MTVRIADVPVFILCGGLGTRLKEMTEFRPKPMIPIGPEPILVHIMRHYSHFGFSRFVLCLGYKSEIIRDYFLNFYTMHSDVTVDLKTNTLDVHSVDHSCDWKVTLAYTGESTMTGARIARAAARYLGRAEHFAVTYGDGLTNADLAAELDFHLSRGKIGTVLGVGGQPTVPVRGVPTGGRRAEGVHRKTGTTLGLDQWRYFFFRRDFAGYLSTEESCVLEREPLSRLAHDGQLAVYQHRDFWACMDTQRDHEYLTRLWESGEAPWAAPAH
jgi:glucose-1-phosphate cytidylyltransferase